MGERPYTGSGDAGLLLTKNRQMAALREEMAIMETRSASEIEQSTEKLLRDLKEVVRDGERLLQAGAEDLSERGTAAREKLTAALDIAKETQQKLQERLRAGAQCTDAFIREHPYQSIGIALGAGLLVGLLAARK